MSRRKRFRVIIENVDNIFERFNSVRSETGDLRSTMEMGLVSLEHPLESVRVAGTSDGVAYGFVALITIRPELSSGPYGVYPTTIRAPSDYLSKKFILNKSGESIFILDGSYNQEFQIQPVGSHELMLATGISGVATFSKAISSAANFKTDLIKFAELLEETIRGIYLMFDAEPPRVDLYLKEGYMPEMAGESTDTSDSKPAQNYPGTDDIDLSVMCQRIKVTKVEGSFSEVGGKTKAKEEIMELLAVLQDPESFRRWGTRPPKGILLAGLPGVGKTLLMQALAAESGMDFYHVKVADVMSMWYGQSERLMQAIFDMVKRNAILFFDEIDALASHRDMAHESSQRMLSVMLQNMDGLEGGKGVIVVAATNRLDSIDPAIRRPGRFDLIIEVPCPDLAGREEIFQIHARKAEQIAQRTLFTVDWAKAASVTDGLTGADIAEVIRRTLEAKLREERRGNNPSGVILEDILIQVSELRKRLKSMGKTKIGFIGG